MPQEPGSKMTSHRLPLSHPQRRVWLTERMYPGTGVGNLAGCIHLPGRRRELPALGAAIRQVLAKHDALRIRLAPTPSFLCEQYFGDPLDIELPVHDVDESRASLLQESKRPFELFDSPLVLFWLLRLPDDRIGFFFKYHHINVDALTVSLLNREIYQAYEAGPTGAGEAQGPSFAEFLARELAYLASADKARDEAFWHEHLADLDPALSRDQHPNPSEIPAGAMSAIDTRRYEHEFDPELSSAIVSYCKERQTTVFRFFLALFAVHFADRHLGRAGAGKDVVLATGHHNRLTPREKSMVGMTVSTLPMRFPTSGEVPFDDYLRSVHQISSACLRRQQYPYDLLSQHLRAGGYDPKQLLRWIINHIPSFDGAYAVERYSPGADLDELNIKINPNQWPRSAPLQLGIDAQLARYDERAVMRIFARVERIARLALAEPHKKLQELRVAADGRARPLARRQERPARMYAGLFEQAARRFADNVALVDERGDTTYRTLLAEVSALQQALVSRGIQPGDRVAIVTDRSTDFVVAALATFACGAAYVPITPDTPEERMNTILRDAGASLVLADNPGLPGDRPRLLVRQHLARVQAASMVQSRPEELAYCIYTSGSTGGPKGVMVPQRGLLNQCIWWAELCDLTERDRVAAYANFMFDVSVVELFPTLLSGATAYIVPGRRRGSVDELGRYFDRHGITVAVLPTKVGELFQTHVKPSTLRMLIVAGERLRPVAARRSYRLINAYGPTEASVLTTTYEVKGDEAEIPIGKPCPNAWVYVVDEQDRLVAPGEEGELLVAGDQVALGYLDDPQSSQALFVENPFADGAHNAIAYRTGDRVRRREDGNLLFVGRRDRQIKVRGFRVELGEVEHCLLEHHAVEQCHILVEGQDDLLSLVAYCVARGDDARRAAALREHAQRWLPGFMVPRAFVFVPAIPLNENGKVDRAALARLGGSVPGASAAGDSGQPARRVQPSNDVERQILALFRRVLKRDAIGVADSFFEQGGDSIRAMELFALIERRYGATLPVSLIFQNPTAATLARMIAKHGVGEAVLDIVVQMKPGSGAQGLFCVHDFSCDVLPYTYLVRKLRGLEPVRGLRWHPQTAQHAASLEEAAALYLRSVKRHQPVGPYYLLGYSTGGTFAYEMARQLLASGERVAFLGLVDTINFVKERRWAAAWSTTALRWALSWIRGMSLDYKIAFITAAVGRVPNLRRLWRLLAAQRTIREMVLRYQPGPIDCDVVLFRATKGAFNLEMDHGWKNLVSSLEVLDCETNHALILDEINSARIAQRIEEALRI